MNFKAHFGKHKINCFYHNCYYTDINNKKLDNHQVLLYISSTSEKEKN